MSKIPIEYVEQAREACVKLAYGFREIRAKIGDNVLPQDAMDAAAQAITSGTPKNMKDRLGALTLQSSVMASRLSIPELEQPVGWDVAGYILDLPIEEREVSLALGEKL